MTQVSRFFMPALLVGAVMWSTLAAQDQPRPDVPVRPGPPLDRGAVDEVFIDRFINRGSDSRPSRLPEARSDDRRVERYRQRTVPPDCDLVRAARTIGIGFGD